MDLGALRDLALDLNLSAHGFPVTVTRPFPDTTPIVTRGLWLRTQNEFQAFGTDLKRTQPRRVLVLPIDEVPNVPRGTTLTAPEKLGDTDLTWLVDGYHQAKETDHWVVLVIPASTS